MRLSDLQSKNIVNIYDGKNIGTIIDANVLNDGMIESLVIEESKKILSFNKNTDTIIYWRDIKKIGEDVILVDKH